MQRELRGALEAEGGGTVGWGQSGAAPPRTKRPIATLAELARRLRAEFACAQKGAVSAGRLQELMAAYEPSSAADWKPFAHFDRFRYTRNLVDAGDGLFNLMMICWGEGHGSAVHDHAGAHCVMRVLTGALQEVRFAWPAPRTALPEDGDEQPLQEIGRCVLDDGDVCYINDAQGLHRVENASHCERAVSLHLYCPPFGSCAVFNQSTGRRSVCPVTFWSRPGEPRVRRRRDRPPPPAEDN